VRRLVWLSSSASSPFCGCSNPGSVRGGIAESRSMVYGLTGRRIVRATLRSNDIHSSTHGARDPAAPNTVSRPGDPYLALALCCGRKPHCNPADTPFQQRMDPGSTSPRLPHPDRPHTLDSPRNCGPDFPSRKPGSRIPVPRVSVILALRRRGAVFTPRRCADGRTH